MIGSLVYLILHCAGSTCLQQQDCAYIMTLLMVEFEHMFVLL